jgi:hypothetical protein
MMNEDKFWQIIDLLDWERDADEGIVAPAVEALSLLSDEDIFRFDDLLAEKLYALDGERFAKKRSSETAGGKAYFSVDDFLYSRCCVVAKGQDFYQTVLKNPNKMPKDCTFESLLYLHEEAWEMKHGEQEAYPHFREVWYETFSNPTGWPGITPLKDKILGAHEAARQF